MVRRGTFLAALVSVCLLVAASGCLRRESPELENRLNEILMSGNEALAAGRYDEAIRQFDAGLALGPGNPALLTNKSHALRSRGVVRFNASLQLGDEAEKAAVREAARRDWREAADLGIQSVRQMKSADLSEMWFDKSAYEMNRRAACSARAEALRLLASKFDKTLADEALAAIHEYAEVERDAETRAKARLAAGQMLLDTARGEQAAAEYRKVLADDPDNLDAVLGVGLALFQSGDKARYREAASHLRRFVEAAPENHPLRKSAKDTLDFMNQ